MKRSFGSNSSNNSGSGQSNKKTRRIKPTSNQRTLGAAWGAASRPTSRSSFGSSPFSDFGSYMSEKNRKLHNQFDTEASNSSNGVSGSKIPIFHGVSIFVDGFTIPSHQELRGYMMQHGGRFENYFSKRNVTHIICSNLPDSKIKNLRSFSRGLPVVKPMWISDSVSANKLLNWVPYQLDQLTDTQPKLSAFFPRVASSDTTCGPTIMNEVEDASSSRVGESDSEIIVDDTDEDNDEVNTRGLQSFTEQPSASISTLNLDKDMSKKHHSTLEDPNFVENYFKSSRLHFIGTWRNRYRKRFHGSSNTLKGHNSIGNNEKTSFIHIDLDCFFVAVVIKDRPELQDKPVAVCHSDNPKGTAEISSANYPARAYGVKAGMFVRNAKELCPQLVIVPYKFEAYEEVADQFYDILHKHCNKVQAISCDEAFIDVSDIDGVDPEVLASRIRKEILESSGCSASAGIADTMLMARLATRKAKPAGQHHIPSDKVDEYLDQLSVDALPGVGYVLKEKLKKQNIHTCSELRLIPKDSLQKAFGSKTGEMLWSYSRGLDHRSIQTVMENKSIGAEVNWGVRFRDQHDMEHFLRCLCKEVTLRLQGCEMFGRNFTLKIKKRRKNAEEPVKYMGCGECDNVSRSITVAVATDEAEDIERIAKRLFGSFHLDVKEIRGLGIQVSKLESADVSKRGSTRSLKSWLSLASSRAREGERCMSDGAETSSIQTSENHEASLLPPMSDLDMEVVESLPPEVLSDLDQTYGGKLVELIERRRGKRKMKIGSSYISMDGEMNDLSTSHAAEYDKRLGEASTSRTVISEEATIKKADSMMPLSFSQVDISVLQELPEDLRADLQEALPPHRQPLSENGPSNSDNNNDNDNDKNTLFVGNPPRWVEKFRVSGHCILKTIAELYYSKVAAQSRSKLSSILQHSISEITNLHEDAISSDLIEESVDNVCELLRQYINFKLDRDIEEIYLCFCLLKRLAGRCEFFLQVYELVYPFLQGSIGENYGGNLNLS